MSKLQAAGAVAQVAELSSVRSSRISAQSLVPLKEIVDHVGQKDSVQQAYTVRFMRICSEGAERMREDHYHKWIKQKDPRVREFAAFKDLRSKTRIPSFPDGSGVRILTHMIHNKKENKIDSKEINKAFRVYEDYLERKARILLQAQRKARRR